MKMISKSKEEIAYCLSSNSRYSRLPQEIWIHSYSAQILTLTGCKKIWIRISWTKCRSGRCQQLH